MNLEHTLQPTDTSFMNPAPSVLAFPSSMHPNNFSASSLPNYLSKTGSDFELLEPVTGQHHPAFHAAGQPTNYSESHNQHLESATTSRDGYSRGSEFPSGKNEKDMLTAGSRLNPWEPQYHHRFPSPDVKSIYDDDLGPSMHGTHNSPLPLVMDPNSNLRPVSTEYYGEVKPIQLTWMQSGDMQNNCGNQEMLESNLLHPPSQPNVYSSSASSLYPHQRYIQALSLRSGIHQMPPLRRLSISDEPMPDHSNYDDEGTFDGMPPPPGIQPNQPDSPEDSSLEILEPYPDMAPEDFEAATTDPDARPRRQRLRYSGDKYTPTWVRHSGQAKEGFCDTCKPGKWLQLKNSAYWYHKQFIHGISSVSGKEFVTPLDHRWLDQEVMEGLCHQCHQWVPISNTKRKNTMLWFRHAHKCHVYHKPKNVSGKKR